MDEGAGLLEAEASFSSRVFKELARGAAIELPIFSDGKGKTGAFARTRVIYNVGLFHFEVLQSSIDESLKRCGLSPIERPLMLGPEGIVGHNCDPAPRALICLIYKVH